MSLLPSAENVYTLGSSRSSGMIVAEYCQRLLTVLSRWLILHFSFALAVKLSCHLGVGTEIVLPLPAGTSFNVPRTAKEPVQQGHDPVQGFFRFFSFPFSLSSLIYEFVPFGQKPVFAPAEKS